MTITHEINLDGIFPKDIIDLHQQGVITIAEIVASGRHYSCFTDDLRIYVAKHLKIQEKRAYQSLPDTKAV